MPTSTIDWTIRMVMLVLAGLVTLSILSSIAAMTNEAGSGGGGFTVERSEPPPPGEVPTTNEIASLPDAAPTDLNAATPAGRAPAATSVAATSGVPQPPRAETARWLEAIAYALLALAGLMALAILLLWRGLRILRRIADAAEGRP